MNVNAYEGAGLNGAGSRPQEVPPAPMPSPFDGIRKFLGPAVQAVLAPAPSKGGGKRYPIEEFDFHVLEGDHVAVDCEDLYFHHGVYLGNNEVCHRTRYSEGPHIDSVQKFLEGGKYFIIIPYPELDSQTDRQEACARAIDLVRKGKAKARARAAAAGADKKQGDYGQASDGEAPPSAAFSIDNASRKPDPVDLILREYNVVVNNCEHLCNLIKTGKANSDQVAKVHRFVDKLLGVSSSNPAVAALRSGLQAGMNNPESIALSAKVAGTVMNGALSWASRAVGAVGAANQGFDEPLGAAASGSGPRRRGRGARAVDSDDSGIADSDRFEEL